MRRPIDEKQLIQEGRKILLLLEASQEELAIQRIAQMDEKLKKQNVPKLATDVLAVWEQIGIAANNMSNRRYFEDVKNELNRVTFDIYQDHAA